MNGGELIGGDHTQINVKLYSGPKWVTKRPRLFPSEEILSRAKIGPQTRIARAVQGTFFFFFFFLDFRNLYFYLFFVIYLE